MDGFFSNSRAPGSDKPCWGILNNFFSNKTHDVSLFFIGLTFHSGMRIINVYNCKYVRLGLVYIFAASLWGFYLKMLCGFCFINILWEKHTIVYIWHNSSWSQIVLEWTVQCSQTVRFFVMFDMFEVQFWAKMWCSEVFEVRSCCYVTRLVLEHTIWCLRTVQFFVMFDMFEVQFSAKMWCLEVFEVRSCCYVTRVV